MAFSLGSARGWFPIWNCSRHSQIAALEAKSDEELAKLGITRDRIVHYVFRDLIWV